MVEYGTASDFPELKATSLAVIMAQV